MNGLREYERDTGILARAGDAELCPPDLALFAGLVNGVPGLLPVRAIDARWEHMRWKPHVSCAALAAVRCEDGVERLVTWKRYATDKARHVAEDASIASDDAALASRDPSASRRVAVLGQEHVVLTAFPTDRVLDVVERAFDLQRSCRLLSSSPRFTGLQLRHRRSSARLVRYKPERRAVIRLDVVVRDAQGELKTVPVGLRVLSTDDATAAARARIESRVGELGLAPELLAFEERTGFVFEAWWDVESLAHDDVSSAAEAGECLARLHAAPISSTGVRFVAQGGVTQDGDVRHAVESSLFEVDRALWTSVTTRPTPAPALGAERAWIHGDFHPDQLARDRATRRLRVLDWDALRVGDPIVDLASWIADAEALGCAATGERELLDGYARAGGRVPEARAIDRAVASALIARAAGSIRRLERGAVDTARRLVDLARRRDARGVGR